MTETYVILIVRAINGDKLFEWRRPSHVMSSIGDVKMYGGEVMGVPSCFLDLVFNAEVLTDDICTHDIPSPFQLTLIMSPVVIIKPRRSYLHLLRKTPTCHNDRQFELLIVLSQSEFVDPVGYQQDAEDDDGLICLLEEAIDFLTKVSRERGDTLVIDVMIPLTDHRCAEVRVAALNALAKMSSRGDTRVIGAAVRRLRDGGHSRSGRLRNSNHHRHHVREAAIGVLLDVAVPGDQDAIDSLIARTASSFESDRIVRQEAIVALKHLSNKDNIAVLLAITDCLSDVSTGVRGAAMDAVPHFSMHVHHEVIFALAEASVKESQKHMRRKALSALIKLVVADHAGAMTAIVSHPRPCVRRAALAMLPEWKDTTTDAYSSQLLTALRCGMMDSNSRVMKTAIMSVASIVRIPVDNVSFSKIGRAFAQEFSERLQHFPAEHASMAVLHHVWVDILVACIQHKANHVRELAAAALGGAPPDDEYTLARLEECLQHRRGNVRRAALSALSQPPWLHCHPGRVNDLLARHTNDPDFWVAQAANRAIKSLFP